MEDYQQNKQPKDARFLALFRKAFNKDRLRNSFDIEEEAHELGMSKSTYDKKMKPSNSENDITVTEWDHFISLSGDYTTLEYMANKYGFELSKLETVCKSKGIVEISSQTDKAMIEFSEAFKVVKDALSDNQITKKEKNKAMDEIDDAIKELQQLKQDIGCKETEE